MFIYYYNIDRHDIRGTPRRPTERFRYTCYFIISIIIM